MRYGVGGGGPLGARKYDIVQLTRGKVLEIGRGPFKVWPHFVALRERGDEAMRPDESADHWCDTFAQGLADFEDGSFDAIVCHSGCTITDAEALRLLRDGGKLVLYTQDDAGLLVHAKSDDAIVLDGPFEDVAPKKVCIVRYGAIGDTIQTASLLPELKRQGYHVTLMCEPRGEELLRNDPGVDRFLVQDKDQVPNQELGSYWAHWKAKFDRWINLCESVEGTLIKLPGRADHEFPKALRHELCNHNYLEFMAKLGELPFYPEHHFYESEQEHDRAQEFLDKIGSQTNKDWILGQRWTRPFVIMWCLAGSAVHKAYPHQDAVIARILTEIPHAHVITVGDGFCEILEAGWENEPRVHCRSGKLDIRDTLALAKVVDLVIGPETGVMNAVAFESNAKVVLLSHSTPENLTKHWSNTEAIETKDTPCYPCHQLHYGWKNCTEHKDSGTALCQWNISPARVWEAVQRAYIGTGTVRKLLETA